MPRQPSRIGIGAPWRGRPAAVDIKFPPIPSRLSESMVAHLAPRLFDVRGPAWYGGRAADLLVDTHLAGILQSSQITTSPATCWYGSTSQAATATAWATRSSTCCPIPRGAAI